ncbi:sentrin-specific protease 1-like [Aphis craccivora]|uniref:Sentrin-specific protease 1-like n=1 Tax=Aphis craccivora TaxID=307492 RepID=A0A6G0YMA0_APHCR|nr:sentrin-specific protease 1-like [Aphis craccivora]
MTKISKPIKTMKRRRRQFKKPLLNVDIASYESEKPSNVCVTQPNNCKVNVKNNLDHSVAQPYNGEVNIENNLDHSVAQPINCEENVINLNDNENPDVIQLFDDDDDDDDNGEINIIDLYERESKQQMYQSLLSNKFQYIPTIEDNKIFPGYNQELISDLKVYLTKQFSNEFINREVGTCTYEDLSKVFVPGAWLTDTIIEQYFQLLIKSCNNNNIYICNSYFLIELQNRGYDEFVERFMNGIRLLNYSKMLIPTHVGDHWVLIVVEIKEKKILCYDSLDYYKYIFKMMENLRTFLDQKYFMQQEGYSSSSSSIEIGSGDSPKQNNSSDCGVFTCINARYIMNNKPLNYTQLDIPLFRHRMLYEIVCSELF